MLICVFMVIVTAMPADESIIGDNVDNFGPSDDQEILKKKKIILLKKLLLIKHIKG